MVSSINARREEACARQCWIKGLEQNARSYPSLAAFWRQEVVARLTDAPLPAWRQRLPGLS
jgi:hypothetical protein